MKTSCSELLDCSRCRLEDRDALQRRARRLRVRAANSSDNGQGHDGADSRWTQFEQAIRTSEALFAARQRGVPAAAVLPHLPNAESAASIVSAITDHQVVIVSGDTGCGKSTQLGKSSRSKPG